jgi:CheY-like chemotaxis protein
MVRPGERPCLLLIDDAVGQRDLYEVALRLEFEVLTATRGEEGVALAASKHPDAIVLDVVMPGIDGWETCTRIKHNPETANIPVILLTGTNEPNLSERAEAVGATAVLLKPCLVDTLRNTVLVAINSYTPLAAGQGAAAPQQPTDASGLVWEAVIDRTPWTATLRGDGSGWWRVQILRAGELAASRRFETHDRAVEWAEAGRVAIAAGGARSPKH